MSTDAELKDRSGLVAGLDPVARQIRWSRILSSQLTYVAAALVIVVLGMATVSDAFVTSQNISNVAMNFSFIAIASVGMTFIIMSGGIDLSVGAVMALAAITSAWVSNVLIGSPLEAIPGLVMVVALGCGLLASAIVGAVNGLLIARVGLSPFITTLGMLSVVRGICYFTTSGRINYFSGADAPLINTIVAGRLFGVPAPFIYLVVIAAIATIALQHTRWGRYVMAIGGNEKAAELTGIPVARIKFSVYLAGSTLAGLAGILIAGWLGSAPANLASGYELTVIAAVVIGGANLLGGTGHPIGAIIGCILIEVIRNGLVLSGVSSYAQSIFVGAIIIAAVLIDRLRSRHDP